MYQKTIDTCSDWDSLSKDAGRIGLGGGPGHRESIGYSVCSKTTCLAVAFLFCTWTMDFALGDWPQILGPTRNGHLSPEDKLPNELPDSPKPKWQIASGEGYAGAIVKDETVYLHDLIDGKQRLRSVSLESGQINWTQEFAATYRGGIDSDRGPKATPIATDRYVVLFSAGSILRVVNRSDGKEVWQIDLKEKYDVRDSYFGAGSTPLVIDERVIVNVGGKRTVGVAAFDISTGKVLWESEKCDASYASPIRLRTVTDSGQPIVVVPTRLTTFGMNAQTGETVFEFPFGARGPTVNAATPVELNDGRVFLTASYGIGSTCVDVSTRSSIAAKEVFSGSTILQSHYPTPVFVNGFLFGVDGREDIGQAALRCVAPDTDEVKWEVSNYGIAHLLTDGESILAVKLNGEIELIQPDKTAYQSISKSNLAAGKFQSVPAWESNHLIVKDCQRGNQRFLCYKLE